MSELNPCPFCGCAMGIESNRDWHELSGDHDERCILSGKDLFVPATSDQLQCLTRDWNRRAAATSAAPQEGRQPVAWYDPMNKEPGQSVTFDPAKRKKWPHLFPVALYVSPIVRQEAQVPSELPWSQKPLPERARLLADELEETSGRFTEQGRKEDGLLNEASLVIREFLAALSHTPAAPQGGAREPLSTERIDLLARIYLPPQARGARDFARAIEAEHSIGASQQTAEPKEPGNAA